MKSSFSGFPKATLQFFRHLERNNNRDWFEAHKPVYLESVKKPMEDFVAAISAELVRFAPELATEPSKAIYRIYRDTRFSPDKTPYKTHMGASFFRADLGKHIAGGLYFEISHKYVGIAGGSYMPTPDALHLMRVHIMENHARFAKLLADKKLRSAMGELQGSSLSRPPKGFPPEHAAMEWIKLKNMYFWQELPAETALGAGLLKELLTRFRLMMPVLNFLNEPLISMRNRKAPLETGWV